jgi:glycosyltransferase involved in cell wall biosynthesis
MRNAVPAGRQGPIKRADALIVGSRRAGSVFVEAGVPSERLHVIPNGVEGRPDVLEPGTPRHGWVVAARLEEPKGVLDLVRQWPQGVPLDVFGAGPQQALVEASCRGSVRFKGQVAYSDLRRRLASAQGLVMPSKWLEMNPTVVSDALALGTPVLAFEANVAAEVVQAHDVGATYSDTATLRGALDSLALATVELERRCIETFESEYSYEVWGERLLHLYLSVRARRSAESGRS